MKQKTLFIASSIFLLAGIFCLLLTVAKAQVSDFSPWLLQQNVIKPKVSTWGLLAPAASNTIPNLITVNSTSTQATTTFLSVSNTASTSALRVSNLTTLGNQTDYPLSSTSTLPVAVNAKSFATTLTATPLLSLDTTNNRIGIRTINPGVTFGVVGATSLQNATTTALGTNAMSFVTGSNSSGAGGAPIDFQFNTGGFRHWIKTLHNTVLNNTEGFEFYLNSSGTAGGSSAAGVGSTFIMGIYGGGLAVASSSPWGRLSVESGTTFGLTNTNPAFVVSNSASSSASLIVGGPNQNGRVGIGTSSPFKTFSIESVSGTTTTVFGASNKPTCQQWFSTPSGNPMRVYITDGGVITVESGACQ